jgi:hypothetical protein
MDEPGRAEGVGAEGVGEGSTCAVEGRDLAWGILILSVDVVLYGAWWEGGEPSVVDRSRAAVGVSESKIIAAEAFRSRAPPVGWEGEIAETEPPRSTYIARHRCPPPASSFSSAVPSRT